MDPPAAVSEETNGNGTADQVDAVNFKFSELCNVWYTSKNLRETTWAM